MCPLSILTKKFFYSFIGFLVPVIVEYFLPAFNIWPRAGPHWPESPATYRIFFFFDDRFLVYTILQTVTGNFIYERVSTQGSLSSKSLYFQEKILPNHAQPLQKDWDSFLEHIGNVKRRGQESRQGRGAGWCLESSIPQSISTIEDCISTIEDINSYSLKKCRLFGQMNLENLWLRTFFYFKTY